MIRPPLKSLNSDWYRTLTWSGVGGVLLMPTFRPARLAVACVPCAWLAGTAARRLLRLRRRQIPAPEATAATSAGQVVATPRRRVPTRSTYATISARTIARSFASSTARSSCGSYERGHEDDPNYVIWQASVGKTARECLYDLQGGLTLKIGVSGRVIAGPKGGAADVSRPVQDRRGQIPGSGAHHRGLLRSMSRFPRPGRPSSRR